MGVNSEKYFKAIFLLLSVIALFWTSLYSYLLFHSIAELFSIVIAATIFLIAWNSKNFSHDNFDYLTFIGIAYLFVAVLDLLHTLSYSGMQIFTDYDYYANQLWIAARYLESLSLLIPFLLIRFNPKLKPLTILSIYSLITGTIIVSIFVFHIFPICFVEGQGQTSFKIISEYIIIGILGLVFMFVRANKDMFDGHVYNYLLLSVVFTMLSELAFISYVTNFGYINMIGHYLKILSFYMMYKAIIETSIIKPYLLIFKELKDKEAELTRLTMVDELTGLYNRRAALEILERSIKASFKSRTELVLCFIDLDDLKRVNDEYGHAAGDFMLQKLAGILLENTAPEDSVCRIGGDEFMIIFPGINLEKAELILLEILAHTKGMNKFEKNTFNLDFSYGFSEYDGCSPQLIDIMMQEADQNMYIQKMQKKGKTPVC